MTAATRPHLLSLEEWCVLRAGIPHYWIVDLDGAEVSLEALTLVDGEYECETVTGVFEATAPFEVRVDLEPLR